MKYIDYIGQRINLHKEIVKSIIEVMDKHGKEEVDLLEKKKKSGQLGSSEFTIGVMKLLKCRSLP